MTGGRAALAVGLALLLASCGGSDDDSAVSDRSAPLASLSEIPLVGVLVADCGDDSVPTSPDTVSVIDVAELGLVHLPQLDTISGTDLEDFLLNLDLHGEELPIVSALIPLQDPALFLPLPVADLLDLLALDSIPLDTQVLGITSLGCEAEDAPPLGLIPVLSAIPS